MGQPKKQRRNYTTPKHMFKGREGERELAQAYGLKNMKELWKAKSEVSRVRGLARELLAKPDEKTEKDMLGRLVRVGLVPKDAKLEDVLNVTIENVLDRRLQTVVFKLNLTTSIKQARQEIVHGHIAVAGQRMTAPGHTCTLEEAQQVDFYAGSPLTNPEHPIRKIEKKASTDAAASREVKAEEVKPLAERPVEEKKEEAPKEEAPLPAAPEGAVVEEKKEEPKEEKPAEEKKEEAPKEETKA